MGIFNLVPYLLISRQGLIGYSDKMCACEAQYRTGGTMFQAMPDGSLKRIS